MSALRRHLSHNVIGYLALFVALGGTSYAVTKNSITSRAIKNNDVRSIDIRNGTITGRDVKKDTLTGARIRESSLAKVPAAAAADTAVNAQSAARAGTAQSAASADSAKSADSAANALALGGLAPAAFQSKVRWAMLYGDSGDGAIAEQTGGFKLLTGPGDTYEGYYALDIGESNVGKAVIAVAQDAFLSRAEVTRCSTAVPTPPGSTVCQDPNDNSKALDDHHVAVYSWDTSSASGSQSNGRIYVFVIG